jgi:hypothetical protein
MELPQFLFVADLDTNNLVLINPSQIRMIQLKDGVCTVFMSESFKVNLSKDGAKLFLAFLERAVLIDGSSTTAVVDQFKAQLSKFSAE